MDLQFELMLQALQAIRPENPQTMKILRIRHALEAMWVIPGIEVESFSLDSGEGKYHPTLIAFHQ
jgi:hypothetical protein